MHDGGKSAAELLHDAHTSGIGKGAVVHVVGGSHKLSYTGSGARKSYIYATCIKDAFQQAGYNVNLVTNLSADDAFCFMASAKIFAPGPGGFSRIIGKLVQLGGGRVVGRSFR